MKKEITPLLAPMKKIICVAPFLFMGTAFLFAQPFVPNSNKQACWHRAKGQGISYADLPEKSKLWSHGMDFTCWNGAASCGWGIGSQNFPPCAAMAWGDYKWIAAHSRYEKGHGIFGRELGSISDFYYATMVVIKMIALRDARAAGAYGDAKDIAESLRCIWAYEALTAIASPRKNCWLNLNGNIHTNAGDAAKYNGLTVAFAGDRCNTEAYINHDDHGELLSWALDWLPRKITPNKDFLASTGFYDEWDAMVAQLTGVGFYAQATDPEVFGLNAADRQKLKDVVNGDVNAALWAAQVVANFGTWKDPAHPVANYYHKIRMRRTTLGAEMIFFHSTNKNKTTQAATQIFNNGDFKSIRPNYFKGTGANEGYTVWVANGTIHADAPCCGEGVYVSMPEMGGTILWEVNIDGSVVSFNGNNVSPAGEATYPTGPDVGVTAITAPGSNITGTSVTPKVTIKNFGASTVNNVYVSYQLDNGPMWTTTWRGTLAPNATVNVTLWNAPVTTGSYTLKVYTGGPNYKPDGNTSNDTQTHNFTVGNPPTQTLDAGINTIVSPTSSLTDDSIQPVGKIKNFGTTALTSANISYKINNGTPVTQPWTGNLASGASANHTFPKVPIAPGTYTIQIYTANPNGGADADATNNSQSLVFNVSSPFITDVEAVSIGEPFTLGCAVNIQPQMVIQNIGPVILDQVTINYQVDADPVVSKTYSVAAGTGLKVGDATGLRGNASAVTAGAHTLKMWTTVPNSAADSDNSNDTVTSAFTVGTQGLNLPYGKDFENTQNGQVPKDWSRYNWDAFKQWFADAMPGNKAMALNNFSYTGAQNTKDDLILPILDFTGNTSVWLTFDLAHASKPGSTVFDSLEVSVSTDCGQTFTSVWGRGGAALNTVADNANLFIPAGPQDYQNVQVDLSAYTASANAIVRFTNWSNNGNMTFIDNVNLASSVIGIEENASVLSLHVFPNPASDVITINAHIAANANVNLQLVNVLGERVLSENFVLNSSGNLVKNINVSSLKSGIYQVVVSAENGASRKKIMVIK